MLTNKLLNESTQSITSDPYEIQASWYLPDYTTLLMIVAEVWDGTTLVERWANTVIYVPNCSSISISYDATVAYISKLGGTIKIDQPWTKTVGIPRYAYLDPTLITIIRRYGYIAIYDGTNKVVEASGEAAVFTLQIKIPRNLAKLLANLTDDWTITSAIYKAPELAEYIGAAAYLRQLAESLRFTNIGTSISIDQSYVYINARFYVSLTSSFDWTKIVSILAGAFAVLTGFLMLIGSAGIALPTSLFLISAGLSIAFGSAAIVSNILAKPSDLAAYAGQIVEIAKTEIQTYQKQLNDYVDSLVAQGKITQEEANTIKNYVNSIVQRASLTMEELKKLIDAAREEGKRSMYPWIATAGVAGVLLGLMIAPRALPTG